MEVPPSGSKQQLLACWLTGLNLLQRLAGSTVMCLLSHYTNYFLQKQITLHSGAV